MRDGVASERARSGVARSDARLNARAHFRSEDAERVSVRPCAIECALTDLAEDARAFVGGIAMVHDARDESFDHDSVRVPRRRLATLHAPPDDERRRLVLAAEGDNQVPRNGRQQRPQREDNAAGTPPGHATHQ